MRFTSGVELDDEVAGLFTWRNDRVLTPIRLTARGRESGVPVEMHFFHLWTLPDGKLLDMEVFLHRADALEAAGLRE